ncbi:hypothetical protein Tco_1178550, partial [Tanacetum coccineum]
KWSGVDHEVETLKAKIAKLLQRWDLMRNGGVRPLAAATVRQTSSETGSGSGGETEVAGKASQVAGKIAGNGE